MSNKNYYLIIMFNQALLA